MPAANAAPPHHRRAGCKPRGGLAFKPQPSQLVQRANSHIQAAAPTEPRVWLCHYVAHPFHDMIRGFLADSSPTATIVLALRARRAAQQPNFADLKSITPTARKRRIECVSFFSLGTIARKKKARPLLAALLKLRNETKRMSAVFVTS